MDPIPSKSLSSSSQSFFDLVYEVVKRIPRGRVTSYVAIARALGSPRSSRLVGTAMNYCHLQPTRLPAHRVVNHSGLLTGKHHFASPTEMQELLELEGVIVKNDKVQNFKALFWNPMDEIQIE